MSHSPIRILHDLHWLTRGGIETWLINLLRYFRNEEVHFDFAVCDTSFYDEEARRYGSNIYVVSHPLHIRRFLRDMREVMQAGNYDVLHSHRPEHAGYLAKIAKELAIPCRIAHAHSTQWCRGRKSLLAALRYWRYCLWGQAMNQRYATSLLGCSSEAIAFFFNGDHHEKNKTRTQFCGIRSEPYEQQPIPSLRRELLGRYRLSQDALVVGSVGSLDEPKNHDLMIRAFAELAKRDSRYVLFIAGEGKRRCRLESQVRSLGLEDRIRMPGSCSNVPELECQLFDVFCLTSLFEGLPVCVMEATAAGLHTVCSDVITQDLLSVIPDETTPLSLNAPVSVWADALEDGIKRRRTPMEGVETIRQTPFSIENSAAALVDIYRRDIETATKIKQ